MTTALDPSARSAGGKSASSPGVAAAGPGDAAARPGAAQTGTGQPPGSADQGPPAVDDRIRRRLHLITVSVALTVLTFVQQPGRIAPDTKADLSIDPIGFLLRAWHLWEPLGDSGQLQNQAYGYFLPMGPFYALGHLLGFPAWAVQRAWWALVLLVAFHGMYRLCQAFGVGTHSIQIIAALTFALSPRMITEVGPVSIEAWPMALAPWVLLPLIRVRPGGEPSAAARSGLAIALCGGVNAVAVGAVLPLPVWWLLTREPGPVRRTLSRWWAGAVVLGIFWWLAPLMLLGRFSPPFLDWVETAAVSTSKASLPGAFRGTTQWVAWFKLPQPIWLAGWSVLSSPAGILLSWLLITIALLGMLRRDAPHRRFLLGASIGGLVLITLGHTGPLTAPWAPAIQNFLDGAGAPLRNTHKFDLIFRIPITLALAHAMTRVRLPPLKFPGMPAIPGGPRALRFIAACALVGSAAPALVGQLPAAGSFTKVPDYWGQAATWLRDNDDGARTLIVPGSSFATSTWGDPHDEPFQALARTKWATRSGVPLSSAGNIRMLNAIEAQLETGRGSTGLAEFLTRAGISRVLLRSDLVRSFQAGSPPLPVLVRSALESSPGLKLRFALGPNLAGERNVVQVADDGLDVPLRAIEIWEVQTPARLADVYPASSTVKLQGGPESLLALADAGRLGSRATVLADDPEAGALQSVPLVQTDTMQRREANFAQVRDNYSAPMTADQPYLNKRKVHDWEPFDAPQVVARYEGVRGAQASSQAGTTTGPWYALDGDDATSWTSTAFAEKQWLQVDLPRETTLPSAMTLTTGPGGADLAEVEVRTSSGAERTALGQTDAQGVGRQVVIPSGPATFVRVTVTKVWPGTELRAASISSLTIPGITAARPLVLPPSRSTAAPDVISLHTTRDGSDGCAFKSAVAICSPRLQTQSEDTDLDRVLQLPATASYAARGSARVRASAEADALLAPRGVSMLVRASSRRSYEPAQRPQAAADRDPGTSWVANPVDPTPALRLSWTQPRTIDRLRWQMDDSLAAAKPLEFEITAGGRTVTAEPDEDGWVDFPAVRTASVQVAVTRIQGLSSLDRATGFPTPLPVGATEIVIPAADDLRRPVPGFTPVQLRCGQGPPISVNGTVIPTRVAGTADDVLRRLPMRVQPCNTPISLPSGQVRLTMAATTLLAPQGLTLDAGTLGPTPQATTAPAIEELGPERRAITVGASTEDQVLAVHENLNPGWRAVLNDIELRTVRVDGWQQGWIIPAGQSGTIDLRFTPGSGYRLALVVGLLLVGLLGAFALPDRRRRTSSAGRRSRHAVVMALPETARGRAAGVLGIVGAIVLGGWWAAAALLVVLASMRLRVPMRNLLAVAGGTAGLCAALSINADERGLFGTLSIFSALILVACMVVRLDAATGGQLGRVAQWGPARRRAR